MFGRKNNPKLEKRLAKLESKFGSLNKQVDVIAERLHNQTSHEFEERKRRSFTIFAADEWVTYHDLTLKGKIDLILDHLGLDLNVKEPDGEPSVKVTKKKGTK